ncbi:MAG: efflux transporter outer membrane subunit [Sphingomonadaceae bacterium]|nr:efflux transporter outer membrane subunit [Sphingomonadaceae bacterium]
MPRPDPSVLCFRSSRAKSRDVRGTARQRVSTLRDANVTRSGLGLVLAASLAGCSFAPPYHSPQIAAPPAYKEAGVVTAAGWTRAQPQDAARGAWWQQFDDPVLADLEARVERASPDLAAALARYDAARAAVRVAAADALPQVSANASAERERESATRPLSTGSAATFNNYTVGGSASWDLDLWGRVRNEVAARRAEAQASAADLANVRLSLQSELADAYYRVRGLDAQKQLLDRTVQAYQRAVDLTVTRHNGGVSNGLDVSRAQNILSDARAQISDVLNQRAAAEHEVAAVIGEPASSFTLAPVQGLVSPPLLPVSLPSELLQRRPDIAEAERRIFAANARIGVAKAAFFPDISLGAAGGFDATHGSLLSNPATFWALGPAQALLTIFDGGRRAAQLKISRADYDEAAANYRSTVLGAFRDVEDQLAAARLLAQESVDERDAATAAQRTEDLAMERYRDGASDYLDVVTAQTAALSAERTALALGTRRLQTAVALVRALGGDFQPMQTATATR